MHSQGIGTLLTESYESSAYVFPHPPKSQWSDWIDAPKTWQDWCLYIHVPFCLQICNFCHFEKRVPSKSAITDYLANLRREIRCVSKAEDFSGARLRGVYFGGGTASLLSVSMLEEIVADIDAHLGAFNQDVECTLECEPSTKSSQDFAKLSTIGVTRVSVGMQSTFDGHLQTLNRRHSADDALRMVCDARDGGICNVHVDLMFGLPGQTVSEWRRSLDTVSSLPCTHVSAYPLYVFNHEPLQRSLERDLAPRLPDSGSETWRRGSRIPAS